ncbi:MAG: CAP domain-containing protein [Oscillospiraceae bacterium]|nr:CAP domain-containing protein [Oscillospiraceae bacterium]
MKHKTKIAAVLAGCMLAGMLPVSAEYVPYAPCDIDGAVLTVPGNATLCIPCNVDGQGNVLSTVSGMTPIMCVPCNVDGAALPGLGGNVPVICVPCDVAGNGTVLDIFGNNTAIDCVPCDIDSNGKVSDAGGDVNPVVCMPCDADGNICEDAEPVVCLPCGSEEGNEVLPVFGAGSGAVALGDVDGSGAIEVSDIALFAKHLLGVSDRTVYVQAMDINKDGKMDIMDFLMVVLHVSGKTVIGNEGDPGDKGEVKPEQPKQPNPGDFASEFLSAINAERAKAGRKPLEYDSDLARAAGIRADELTRLWDGSRPDGSSWSTVLEKIPYRDSWQVRSSGAGSASETADRLLSGSNRDTLLAANLTHLGVGYAYSADSEYGHYWALLLIEADVSGQETNDFRMEMLNAVNAERAKAGLNALVYDEKLMELAAKRADEEAYSSYPDHNRPNGDPFYSILQEAGLNYRYCAENWASGKPSVAETMNQWMNSEGHRANILNPKLTHFGIGYTYVSDSQFRHYWVQLFAQY